VPLAIHPCLKAIIYFLTQALLSFLNKIFRFIQKGPDLFINQKWSLGSPTWTLDKRNLALLFY